MAERVTVQLVRANRGGRVLVEAGGDSLDEALAAFDVGGDHGGGSFVVRATADLADGYARIEGDPARSPGEALDNFSAAAGEYSSGPGWGGSG